MCVINKMIDNYFKLNAQSSEINHAPIYSNKVDKSLNAFKMYGSPKYSIHNDGISKSFYKLVRTWPRIIAH